MLARQPRRHVFVDELRVVAHQRAVHLLAADLAARIDHELDDQRRAIDVRKERREIVREALGEHRKDGEARVERRRRARGVLVDRAVLRHEGVDVGDADQNANVAVRQALAHLDLIEIARLAVVDRRPEERTQIALAVDEGGLVAGERSDLGDDVALEVGVEPVVGERLPRGADDVELRHGRASVARGATEVQAHGPSDGSFV